MPEGATRLADLTTLRVGGPARRLVQADTESALVDAVREADETGTPLLVVAGAVALAVHAAPRLMVHAALIPLVEARGLRRATAARRRRLPPQPQALIYSCPSARSIRSSGRLGRYAGCRPRPR